ncbi:MAG: pyrroline-5-carboxylate reductase [Geminicoccaceae bacterium]|nr:pyrroline-5-carboxylate reductase [Geminicoccaceae bacterium]
MAGLAGPLLLAGCGRMGGALLQGWIDKGLPPTEAFVVEPDGAARERAREAFGVVAVGEVKALPDDLEPRALVVAVKPQAMATTLPAYRPLVERGAVVLSIAAGTTIARFEAAFGDGTPVVRAMPNTPAAINQGASALVANSRVSEEQKALCLELMRAVGDALWLDDEEQIHVVTAMSGGGPAYVFLLIEALAQAGAANGLPDELAIRLARATVIGSGALAASDPAPAAELRRNVTSPGGTTEAALAVLLDDASGLQRLLNAAIAAAVRRSHELG